MFLSHTVFLCAAHSLAALGALFAQDTLHVGNPPAEEPYLLHEDTATACLRESIRVAFMAAADSLTAQGGFSASPRHYLAFPEESKNVELWLIDTGFGKEVDEAVVLLNKAADLTALMALPVLAEAADSADFENSVALLKSSLPKGLAAFKTTTSRRLETKVLPLAATALDSLGATQVLAGLMNRYNSNPLAESAMPDFDAYLAKKVLARFFSEAAKAESQLWASPALYPDGLLKTTLEKLHDF